MTAKPLGRDDRVPPTARDAHHVSFRDARLVWRDRPAPGNAAMNAVTAPKSRQLNRLEGFALTAIFQGLPTFAIAVLMLKLTGATSSLARKAAPRSSWCWRRCSTR